MTVRQKERDEDRTEVEATDRIALRHPVFLAAAVVLVLNDHVLKGAGILPGWATGKLSDLAGMVVAPIALSALIGARSRRARGTAFVLVAGWFVAANLVPMVAEATRALGATMGFAWSFWADPTDLVALAVLPVAWRVASTRPDGTRGARNVVRVAEQGLLGLAVAACVASPVPDPSYNTAAFVVNRTDRELQVQVRWAAVRLDCAEVRDRVEEVLTRTSFESGTRFNLAPGATLPLDRGTALGERDVFFEPGFADAGVSGGEGHRGDCEVAMVRADGLPEVIVFWEGLVSRTIPLLVEDETDETAVEGGLALVPVGESETALQLAGAPGYQLMSPLEAYSGGPRCEVYESLPGFAWTEIPPGWTGEEVRLTRVEPTIDDCMSLTMERAGTEPIDVFLCIPPADFPFAPNSVVRLVDASPSRLHMVRDLETDTGLWRTGELVVVRGVERVNEGPFDVRLESLRDDCRGIRMDCGGFRIPAAGAIQLSDGTRYVNPGEAVERTAADGRRARLRVGRSEQMLATHASCGAGQDQLGARLEALVTYGEEPR